MSAATHITQQRLLDWIVSRGGKVHRDLDLFHDIGNGERGVCALKAIKEGEQLLLLPEVCSVHIPNADEWEKCAPLTHCAPWHLHQPGLQQSAGCSGCQTALQPPDPFTR